MNLKRQLLLVSLLTLMLPWAGCEFIRETESALRAGQQQMLVATARAHALSMAQYAEEYPRRQSTQSASQQVYVHELGYSPSIDGYFDDWELRDTALRSLQGTEGPVRFATGSNGGAVFLYVEASDRNIVYSSAQTTLTQDRPQNTDRVVLSSSNPPYWNEEFVFAPEGPGPLVSYKKDNNGKTEPETAITASWQEFPGGYRLEAKIPARLLGTNLGILVSNTASRESAPTRLASYRGDTPPPTVKLSDELLQKISVLNQPGMRLLLTDASGWRIAATGDLSADTPDRSFAGGWSRRIYNLLVEAGEAKESAAPDPSGRERQPYVSAALDGSEMTSWFRGEDSGRAIVAAAAPVVADGEVIGAVILQQGTEAILSLTNAGLRRLINVTLIATLLVAAALLGYASWLSRRIRQLSAAAEDALENERLQAALPSALANDEIGDLSRSFSYVLGQIGDYNNYLRTLASKLSHELRTPLAIVTSSLENLEHEPLSEAGSGYTARAREGADRLRGILSAMSEASRVEELMKNVEPEVFDLRAVLSSTTAAYRDAYPERRFEFDCDQDTVELRGAPELLIQMLDKLVDNAVDFSAKGDRIDISLSQQGDLCRLAVANPGPALPDSMRSQLFDSMVSVRGKQDTHNLGLGLYVAKLITEGHGGRINANNIAGGVEFVVLLPAQDSR